MTQSDLHPACRVTPTSATQVANTVQFLAEANCKFAVRGGGHSSWAGGMLLDDPSVHQRLTIPLIAANIGGHGITIDLSAFNNIHVSTDRSSVTVGAGNRWYDVYNALEPLGLAVSGGRVAQVGVSGLTLGGKLPAFKPWK